MIIRMRAQQQTVTQAEGEYKAADTQYHQQWRSYLGLSGFDLLSLLVCVRGEMNCRICWSSSLLGTAGGYKPNGDNSYMPGVVTETIHFSHWLMSLVILLSCKWEEAGHSSLYKCICCFSYEARQVKSCLFLALGKLLWTSGSGALSISS